MTASDSVSGNACPPWCAGHDDEQEPTPPRWHRSEGVLVPVVERRQARLGRTEPAPLFAEEYVVALEQDQQVTYLYIGPLEDDSRFLAISSEGARRLHAAIGGLITEFM
ncbi:hypothetical protein [Microbacterium sp. RURRCA19A]|uniref:DUF6907 domain-containing protein n=1 Tax=Microbacterium sp. RURRCA19A TaxID=1907391 RepID=UPI0009573171|nr:hypothetical protein [Microbacterium sp. RURRCA19A]SIS19318.1 hypothetical protein SAMN05880568_3441 [Microbacterium sp. RURRCA19A]